MINKTAVHIISRLLVLCSSCQCWSSLCCSRLTSGWRKGHDEPRGWLIGQCVYEVYRPHEYKDYYIIPWYVPVFPVFFHPIYCFRPTSPPASLSCQIRGHIAGTPPPPTTVRAFVFIARRVQHFLLSSSHVESCIHTLLPGICYLVVNFGARKSPWRDSNSRNRSFSSVLVER